MQNKGLNTMLAILFGLVSLYQLSYTYLANTVEDSATQYANAKFTKDQPNQRAAAEAAYLDSVSSYPIMMGIDYKTAKEKELNKGLDLKGGINVILQISVQDILKGLSNNTKDPAFNQALANAGELQKDSQDTFLESFYIAFEALDGDNVLASPDIFFNKGLEDDINATMTNDEVKKVINRKIDESITSAFEVLRKRIDKFGVTQPNIQRLGTSGRILVELPGAKDVERVKNLLQSTAQLEFWETFKNDQLINFLVQANDYLKTQAKLENPSLAEENKEKSAIDDLLADVEAQDSTAVSKDPLFELIRGYGAQGGPVVAQFA